MPKTDITKECIFQTIRCGCYFYLEIFYHGISIGFVEQFDEKIEHKFKKGFGYGFHNKNLKDFRIFKKG